MTIVRGERVVLRPLTEADAPAVLTMLREPAVARWWGRYDSARVQRDLYEDDDAEVFAIEVACELAGIIQWSEENEPEYRHASLDLSLATRFHGQRLGREALRLAIEHLVSERGHHRFTIDPSAKNQPAIRCYAGVGFRPVGLMRRYWRAPDGEWRDALLMDLLADELVRETSTP